MGIHGFASRRTTKLLVTGDLTLTVVSGQPIQVCGLLFNNTTGSTIRININQGDGTLMWTVDIPAFEFREIQTHWLADTGLQLVATGTGSYVTVFHNSPGN